ncbi:hypothetical protein I79_007019 [Cricetulus griseus]|nr:hypothetical protein I79_007019 [Cricetulus griseus]
MSIQKYCRVAVGKGERQADVFFLEFLCYYISYLFYWDDILPQYLHSNLEKLKLVNLILKAVADFLKQEEADRIPQQPCPPSEAKKMWKLVAYSLQSSSRVNSYANCGDEEMKEKLPYKKMENWSPAVTPKIDTKIQRAYFSTNSPRENLFN